MKIGPREQIIAAAAAVVIVVVVLGALLVWPQYQQLSALDARIGAARANVESAKALLALRVQSKDRASETDAKWLRLANLVPEGPDLPSLVVELQDAAFASGVQVTGITPNTPRPATGYYAIPVQVVTIGTWADTVDYLQRIYRLNRGLRVVSVSTARTTNSEQKTKENLLLPDYAEQSTIQLEAYMIPSSPATSQPAPAPAPAH